MHHDEEFSLASAQRAGAEGRLADWVTAFLASPGSDNEALAGALVFEGATYLGPLELDLDRLTPMAGPEEDQVVVPIDQTEWGNDIDAMAESLDQGWEPPPLLVSYRSDGLYLEDGNHRHESLRRQGADRAWAIIVFAGDEDRAQFLVPFAASARPSAPGTGSEVRQPGQALRIRPRRAGQPPRANS